MNESTAHEHFVIENIFESRRLVIVTTICVNIVVESDRMYNAIINFVIFYWIFHSGRQYSRYCLMIMILNSARAHCCVIIRVILIRNSRFIEMSVLIWWNWYGGTRFNILWMVTVLMMRMVNIWFFVFRIYAVSWRSWWWIRI